MTPQYGKCLLALMSPLCVLAAVSGPAPAQAQQANNCDCLASESSPCTCTKNWKISPLATHTYLGICDANNDGVGDARHQGGVTYGMRFGVQGKNKNTSCAVWDGADDDILFSGRTICTNWSLTKKDSTSTEVICFQK